MEFNSWWFILQTLVALSAVLFAFRAGKAYLMAYIAVAIVLMNIFVVKQASLFGLDATLGNVMYASLFLATDLLSEHYGKKEALKAVWLGFTAAIFAMLMTQFALVYEPNSFDFAHGSFETLFSLTPRIVLASLASYLVVQHIDIHIFHALKKKTEGRLLWLRNNVSTLVAQLFDSFLFNFIAFYGVFEGLFEIALFTFAVKAIIALLDTPILYISHHQWFKPEGVQHPGMFTRIKRFFHPYE